MTRQTSTTIITMKGESSHLLEVVPFTLSSLDSFDQPDQRDMSPSCDGFFATKQCGQDNVLQGDTNLQLQPDGDGVKATTSNLLSIFRPRFQNDYHCYEHTRYSNQASDYSYDNSASRSTTLQHKRYVQVSSIGKSIAMNFPCTKMLDLLLFDHPKSSGKARQVSVGCESTFSSTGPSFDLSFMNTSVDCSMKDMPQKFNPNNIVVESREDSVDSERGSDDLDKDMNARAHQESTRIDSRPSSLLSDKRKRQEVYNAETIKRNIWSPSTCDYRAILATRAKLFTHFTFLLPDLKISVMNYVANQKSVSNWLNENQTFEEVIARRRLLCAVQAYGGNAFRRREKVKRNDVSSIFRLNNDELALRKSSSECYEEKLQLQYFENGSHLSWDVEESKLQARLPDEDDGYASTEKATNNIDDDNLSTTDRNNNLADEGDASTKTDESVTDSDDAPKLKYRCKLCGQPKQNHSCPFQQALERNIGTMTFSAVNAFQSHEPGELATPLSEMNNFVDLENDEHGEYPNITAKRPLEIAPSIRTPENEFIGKRRKTRVDSTGTDRKYKGDEKLFHKLMDIKPEQFRTVSVLRSNLIGDYRYPTLPLTFDQRKGASEDLFQLCQEISGLTDDCAKVLQVARNTDLWDLAVAELVTQILVAIKCGPGDEALDGLRYHLMCMGFSC